jgi:hypothetical protein
VEKLISMKPSPSPCREPRLTPADLIDEWLPKLAVNAGAALDARTQAVFHSVWLDGLGDLSPEVMRAAFQATLRTCKFWPVKVADIREYLEHTKETATDEAAEQAWQRILDLRRRFWNPDMPGGFSSGMPELSPRIDRAARAAGVFRDHETVEALHVWAKKKFIESFTRWGELEQDKFLLPDGEIKNLLTGAAQLKALPAASDNWPELHTRGLTYGEKTKADAPQQPDLKHAIRQSTFKPSVHSLDEQKQILREKGFLPESKPGEVSA